MKTTQTSTGHDRGAAGESRRLCGRRTPDVRGRRGFTLIELLTVMMIGIILMSISSAAYFGMVRSSMMAGSVSSVRTVLEMARQHAITCRRRTYVMIQDVYSSGGVDRGRLCVCEHVGTHVGGAGNRFTTDIIIGSQGQYKNCRVFNIDSGQMGTVSDSDAEFLETDISWGLGDRCGLIVHDWVSLPEGIVFTNVPNLDLVYKQDGTVPDWGTGYDIDIVEEVGAGQARIRIDQISGFISVIQGVID